MSNPTASRFFVEIYSIGHGRRDDRPRQRLGSEMFRPPSEFTSEEAMLRNRHADLRRLNRFDLWCEEALSEAALYLGEPCDREWHRQRIAAIRAERAARTKS